MARPEITWRGLTLGGEGGPFRVQSIDGWEDLPPTRNNDEGRARNHGDHAGLTLASGRTVTVKGVVVDRDNAEQLVPTLQAATRLESEQLHELTINLYGRTLTAFARIERRHLPQDLGYGVGLTPWALQWTCPDPLRYGPLLSDSTGLPTSSGGLTYPLGYPLDYGVVGENGQIAVTNPGTAPAALQLAVTGAGTALASGFEVSAATGRLSYAEQVPAGQVVSIDTAAGTVLVEGTSDRRANLVAADWLQIPAADPDTGVPGSLTLQFTSLGGSYDAGAQLAAQWRASYW